MKIINPKIKQFLELTLNKNFELITDQDLSKIECIGINSQGQDPLNVEKDFIELISHCPNIKVISLKNTCITPNMQQQIVNRAIISINLEGCAFAIEEKIELPKSLLSFEMRKSFMDKYDNLLKSLPNNLESLTISFPADESTIEASLLNHLTSVKKVNLEGCIINFSNMSLPNCQHLNLLNTKIDGKDISVFYGLPSLKDLYISSEFNRISELESLKQKCNIKNNLNEFTFDPEEEPSIKK